MPSIEHSSRPPTGFNRHLHGLPLFLSFVLVSRILMIVGVVRLTGGAELASDVAMHWRMVAAPWDLLMGNTTVYGQHPPLLPLLEAVFMRPLEMLLGEAAPFWAPRLTFILWELLLGWLFWLATALPFTTHSTARAARLAFCLNPCGWMTTAVMAQDEVIAATFLLAAVLVTSRGHRRAGLLLCGLGVVAGKIFLLLGVLGLSVHGARGAGRRGSALVQSLGLGLLPVGLIYGWVGMAAFLHGNPWPLSGFVPEVPFGVNIWPAVLAVTGLATVPAMVLSLVLVAVASGVVCTRGAWEGGEGAAPQRLAVLLAALFFWMLAVFYHVNPEYYLLACPLGLLAAKGTRDILLMVGVCALPWGVNLFYGISRVLVEGGPPGKAHIARLYERIIGLDPHAWHGGMLLVSSVATLAMGAYLTARVGWRRP